MVCVGDVRPPRTPFFRDLSPKPEQLPFIHVTLGNVNFIT